MKRFAVLALTLSLLLCLAACGGPAALPAATPAPTEEPAAPTEEPAAPTEEPAPASAGENDGGFVFRTTDRDGGEWDQSVFAGHRVTMVNFWEPWCGPCVGEMGDLERLRQTYGPDLQILGVYATPGMEEEVDDVLERTGVTYPILHYTEDFALFQTGYVPTTVFFDSQGALLAAEGSETFGEIPVIVGSRSYDGWAAMVEGLL